MISPHPTVFVDNAGNSVEVEEVVDGRILLQNSIQAVAKLIKEPSI